MFTTCTCALIHNHLVVSANLLKDVLLNEISEQCQTTWLTIGQTLKVSDTDLQRVQAFPNPCLEMLKCWRNKSKSREETLIEKLAAAIESAAEQDSATSSMESVTEQEASTSSLQTTQGSTNRPPQTPPQSDEETARSTSPEPSTEHQAVVRATDENANLIQLAVRIRETMSIDNINSPNGAK